jgi:hypothetical protein
MYYRVIKFITLTDDFASGMFILIDFDFRWSGRLWIGVGTMVGDQRSDEDSTHFA